jgi:tripartite ATP-independent transporter DctM subunit
MGAIAILVVAAFLGLPLFVVLGGGALLGARAADLDPAVLMIEMLRLTASPNLVAIPLFVLTGVVLARGGAPARWVRVFNAVLGWMPGGLALVALSACMVFTAFSGASGVTILALGGLLYPMLIQERYGERHALGLLTAAGSMGLLLPPSLAVLLYGVVAQVSIEQLFAAGVVPSLLLFGLVGAFSVHRGRAQPLRHAFRLGELGTALRQGAADLLLPLGVVAGLALGYLTIAETAACAASYALLLEAGIYRTLATPRQLSQVIQESAVLVGSIFVILGVAMGLTNLLIDAQLPGRLLALVRLHVTHPWEFLLWMNLFLLLVGCMMDIFSAIVVITPLLLPVAYQFGIHPVHLGIVVLANLEIGYLTPPVGINLFLASQRFELPIFKVFRATLPFLALLIVWLAVITYVPWLSLWWNTHGH